MDRLKARAGYRWLGYIFLLIAGLAATRAQESGKKWEFTLGTGVAVTSSAAISPDGKTIYVGTDAGSFGRVVAIDLANRSREKWKFDRTEAFNSSPAVAPDGTVYIGCDDGKLYALHGETGARLWEVDTGAGGFVFSSPAIGADGTVYFGAGDSKLHAVPRSGPPELWKFPTDGYIDSSPAIGPDGTIYFGSSDRKLYAVKPDGTAKWAPFVTNGAITKSPAIGPDGTVYIGSKDQKLYAIAADGTKKWEFLTNDFIYASPIVGPDGTIYFGVERTFYALNPDGTEKWKTDIASTTGSTAAIRGDGVIVFGADDHKVHFLNSDGSPRPSFDNGVIDDLFEASPLVGPDGTIYIGSLASGRLYALNGNSSPLSVYASWPAWRRNAAHTGRALATGTGQLLNISARAQVSATSTLIAGLAVTGGSQKAYLIRGVGPTLAQYGVSNPMSDPRLDFFLAGSSVPILRNDNWNEQVPPAVQFGLAGVASDVGAFPLPENSKDAALIAPLGPGLFTAHVSSANQQGGVVLLEAYDAVAGDPTARIVNLSTRGRVGTGDDVLIPGIVVGGTGTVRLLVRGVGPGLTQFNVPGVLAQPRLTVFSGAQTLGTNTGWMSDGLKNDLTIASLHAGAFQLADNSPDCALILEATAGAYTIQVSGVGGTSGEALVEIYLLP